MTSPTPRSHVSRPSITCREVLDFLMSYLDDDLSPDEKQVFERHLGVCSSCVNYLESYKATIRMGKAGVQGTDESASGIVPEALIRAIHESRHNGA